MRSERTPGNFKYSDNHSDEALTNHNNADSSHVLVIVNTIDDQAGKEGSENSTQIKTPLFDLHNQEDDGILEEDIISLIKSKPNVSSNNIILEEKTEDFKLDLPIFGISVSLAKDTSSEENTTFGISLPTFGFDITLDKDPS